MANIIGLVLARGGSKRIPNKNLKELQGKPLIAHTIETAIGSGVFTKLIVSTDSRDIAEVSLKYGAEVPWLRPTELSTDKSLSIDAVLHAIEWMNEQELNVDGVMLLQPTSPFRSKKTILSAVDLFEKNNFRPVVSFSVINFQPEWCFRKESPEHITPILGWEAVKKRSQDIKPTLQLNGLIYLATPKYLTINKSFLGENTIPLICECSDELLDIDTEEDWVSAEKICRKIKVD